MTELSREAVTVPEEKAPRAAADPRPARRDPTEGIGLLGAAVGVFCLTSYDSGGGQSGSHIDGEANPQLPKLDSVSFLDLPGNVLLGLGLIVCALGLVFGITTYSQLNHMPVHTAMRDVSELIYITCRTYLKQQGRFLLLLQAFIAAIIVIYYLFLVSFGVGRTTVVILFSLIGMSGSYAVTWYGIRVNTLINSRTAYAAMSGRPYPCHDIPLRPGMSIGMVLISVELAVMLVIMVFLPGEIAGSCFIGFVIDESLDTSALRIASGISTKIADIGADLVKIVFHVKEDDTRNPGVITDCTGDNAGDSVGPSADDFETYGVTGVTLITFILLGVQDQMVQVQLLVWIFMIRAMMVVTSGIPYFVNAAIIRTRYRDVAGMDSEAPLTLLVWLTSVLCIACTFGTSAALIGGLPDGMQWELSLIVSFGTLAGALIPKLVKMLTSTNARHTHEVVVSSNQGEVSLSILSGLVAGNFPGYWIGLAITGLMGLSFIISTMGLSQLMIALAVFVFGLVAFGFLGIGPVTITVDSYGPATDNAQSVFELSVIEEIPDIEEELERDHGIRSNFERAKHFLETSDGASNTFRATAEPVLIGTAVVGATTMIFSVTIGLTSRLTENLENLSLLHAPFLLDLLLGGAVVYWFTGASVQAATTDAYRAVEFIKQNLHLDGETKASAQGSNKVAEIYTQHAQKGMFNILLDVFFATLAFAFTEPFLFVEFLVAMALFGFYQAIFMANAGGAWDNAKKLVEVDLDAKNTSLHDATVAGDTVGDLYKDTSSVALNPVIRLSTLFGLLVVGLVTAITTQGLGALAHVLTVVLLLVSGFFCYRSFYGMRIDERIEDIRA